MNSSRQTKQEQATDAYIKNRLKPLIVEHGLLDSLKTNFPNQSLNIMSIGCGDAPIEIPALETLAKEYSFSFTYKGLDIDADAINQCKTDYPANEFFQVDCCDLEQIKKIAAPSSIHILISRQPVFWSTNPASKHFQYIFTTTIPYLLSNNGALLISFYHREEKENCVRLMKSVTDVKQIELKESTEVHWLTEYRNTHFRTDKEIKLYSDRFFVAHPDFKSNLALKAEQQVQLTEEEEKKAAELGEYLLNELNAILQKADSHSSTPSEMEKVLHAIIAEKTQCSVNNRPSLEAISWLLVKRGDCKKPLSNAAEIEIKKRLLQISRMILRHEKIYSNNQFIRACYQGLQLLSARPLPTDLVDKKNIPTPSMRLSRISGIVGF